ncbi:MAG: di-heme oxidoredictase family protein [Candidatus Acidiferrales bacterium]
MKLFAGTTLFFLLIVMVVPQSAEAPTGFDNQTNGFVDQATHASDQTAFEAVLQVAEGLGPLYNAQSCRECHQNPTSGGQSQITELRVGHLGPDGHFQNPEIPIADGTEIIKGRSLVNDRAICPNAAFPNTQIQERVPESETVRTFRTSLNLLGDGFVEAIADQTLLDLARSQCKTSKGRICGQALYVPILEAPGQTAVGRFGWKDQHASLLSFAGDAYLNEMGITNKLFPTEVTLLCNTVKEPNDVPGADGFEHIDEFARFIRATEAPARDAQAAETPDAQLGEMLFNRIGCATCHVPTLTTAPEGTAIDGGTLTIPTALGGKTIHPYSDFLLHDVGTGDGIIMSTTEHYGRTFAPERFPSFSLIELLRTQNKVRTPPLWGLRLRSRLMHDGASLTFHEAILRHQGEAAHVTQQFAKLNPKDQQAILDFLRSL